MKKCKSCGIQFNTSSDICPLCQKKLSGTEDTLVYPNNIRVKTNMFLYKCLVFLSLVAMIIVLFLDLYIKPGISYAGWVAGGLITNIIVTRYILKNSYNVLKMFEKYGILIIIIIIAWYIGTKSVIITNFIIPGVCLYELLFNCISAIVLKNYIKKYMNIILMNIFLSIIPFVLVLFGLTTFNLLAYICLLFAVIIFIALLMFYNDEIIEEIKKVFNL